MAFRRILCVTDFSSDSSSALRRAVLLAAEHRAPLEVLHVVARDSLDALRLWVATPVDFSERLVAAVRAELDACAAPAAREAGIRIEPRVVVGDVTEAVLESAASADLLVLGAHGTNPLKDALLGTTAERIIGRSSTPMLVVRAPAEQPYRTLLVAVDLLGGSEETYIAALAFGGGATLIGFHVYEVPFESMLQRAGVPASTVEEHRGRAYQEALEKMAVLSERASGDRNRFLAFSERGHPAATIVEGQRKLRADLVVIRKRARPLTEAVLLGSVTRHVLADVASDVLLLTRSR